jgi:beta-glucosidase
VRGGIVAGLLSALAIAAPAQAVTPLPASALPASFSWGVAGSAYQSEGGFTNSNWDVYTRENPSRLQPYGTSVDFRHRYRSDIALAKHLGVTQFRFGINWARVEPKPGEFDQTELAYYDDVVKTVIAAGMRPQITLDHWTYPKWVYDQSAWNNAKTVGDYLTYAKLIAERYKGLGASYITFNEAFFYMIVEQVYRPLTNLLLMSNNLIEAHNRAYDLIHAVDPSAEVSSNVVWMAQRSNVVSPVSDSLFLNGVQDKLDFIAYDYYYESTGDGGLLNVVLGKTWETPQYPQDIYVSLHDLAARFPGKPIYIVENGMPTEDGKPRADGWTRSQALSDSVYWVQRAWADGVDVRGYQYWSLTDNYEWGNYTSRFGLYSVDVLGDKTLTRRPTDAVATYTDIVKDRGVAASYKPKLIRCSDSARELTCPAAPDLPVVRSAPRPVATPPAPLVTLRLRRVRGGMRLVATLRGATSATRARVTLMRGRALVARRTVALRAGRASASFAVHRGGRYRVKARAGDAAVASAWVRVPRN